MDDEIRAHINFLEKGNDYLENQCDAIKKEIEKDPGEIVTDDSPTLKKIAFAGKLSGYMYRENISKKVQLTMKILLSYFLISLMLLVTCSRASKLSFFV